MTAPVLDMNPEIRARWTAALRSGDYQQGREQLHYGGTWCCLGVLCDLAEKDGVITSTDSGQGWRSYGGCHDYPPDAVVNWAGLPGYNPRAETPGPTLVALNDSGASFLEIADAIDGGAS